MDPNALACASQVVVDPAGASFPSSDSSHLWGDVCNAIQAYVQSRWQAIGVLQQELEQEKNRSKGFSDAIAHLTMEKQFLERALSNMTSRGQTYEEELKGANAQVGQLIMQLTQEQSNLKKAQAECSSLRAELDNLRQELMKVTEAAEEAEHGRAVEITRLTSIIEELKALKDESQKESQDAQAAAEDMEQVVQDLRSQLAAQTLEVQALKQNAEKLELNQTPHVTPNMSNNHPGDAVHPGDVQHIGSPLKADFARSDVELNSLINQISGSNTALVPVANSGLIDYEDVTEDGRSDITVTAEFRNGVNGEHHLSPSTSVELNRELAMTRREAEELKNKNLELESALKIRDRSMNATAQQFEAMVSEYKKIKRDLERQLVLVKHYKVLAEIDSQWLKDQNINTTLLQKGLHINGPHPRYVSRPEQPKKTNTYKPYLQDVSNGKEKGGASDDLATLDDIQW